MAFVLAVMLLVSFCLILTVLLNPKLKIKGKEIPVPYWIAPLLGALFLLISKTIPIEKTISKLTGAGSINPIKILILFLSMTFLSIFLDEAGFFSYLSVVSLKRAGNSQMKLFTTLYILVSVLTVFTSNDIIILTFTPFICYFSKEALINPMPYLFGEFVAANTWSMIFIIGNPTNIYLGTAAGLSFFDYFKVMALPTVLAGFTAYLILLLVFHKSLSIPMVIDPEKAVLKDKGLVVLGLVHLSLCTICLILSSYFNFEMWYISFGFALSLIFCSLVYMIIKRKKLNILSKTLKREPWELAPFVLSMFIIVLSLEEYKVTSMVCSALGNDFSVLKYGVLSFLSANILNNIPMSVAASSVTQYITGESFLPATYACIIGSNIGAYLTPLGALAGIMWQGILNKMEIDFSFKDYFRFGVIISIPVLLAALLGLMIVFH